MSIETHEAADGPYVDAGPEVGLEDGFWRAQGVRSEQASGGLFAGTLSCVRRLSCSRAYIDWPRTLTVVREIYNHLLGLECTGVPSIRVWDRLGLENRVTLAVELKFSICFDRVSLEEAGQILVGRV